MSTIYRDMSDAVRAFMVEEVELDGDSLYGSSYFTDLGSAAWRELLLTACRAGTDVTLAAAVSQRGYIRAFTTRTTKGRTSEVKVPVDANETISESNFYRFYLRGVCRLAIAKGITHLIGYRAKAVMQPRPGSEEKIGASFSASAVLADLRVTMRTTPALGMPPGVGSGILAHLP